MKTWERILVLGCVAGSGADGGAYFAFSTFVMQALATTPVAQRIDTMQQINTAAVNPWFALALFGTGVSSLVLGVKAWQQRNMMLLLGCVTYITSLLITFLCNVPLNNQLAAVHAGSSSAAEAWQSFVAPWMAWNHLRTITALISTVCFAAALLANTSPNTTKRKELQ